MQEFDVTYEKWRRMLLHTNLVFVVFVFLVELLMFFLFQKSNLLEQSLQEYMIHFLILPTGANFLILIIGYIAKKFVGTDSQTINYIPAVQQVLICLVVASTHFYFKGTLCIFCLPLMTTVIFGDRKMTYFVGILCSFALLAALLCRKYSEFALEDDSYILMDAIVAYAVLLSAGILCNVLIKFQKEKSDIIQEGYIRQLEMHEQLNKDQKTGLYGNNTFMNMLARVVDSLETDPKPIAVAFIDIDDFKQVNDMYGHLKGDQVILHLAELMKKRETADHLLARFGGEEFAVIFCGDEVNRAFSFLENLRHEFEIMQYSFGGDRITISIGLAVREPGWTPEELFDHADAAMYVSKSQGKNRTTIYKKEWYAQEG